VTESRLGSIEDALRSTFLSMPKNAYGNLDHSSVRYVLHRLFVQRHGMYVKGLEPGSETLEGSSPTELLDNKVPAYVQALFEERLSGRGLGMHEIAILAATLEHLIHNEAVGRLEASYQAHGWSKDETVGKEQVEDVIDTYMVLFILGKNVSVLTPEVVLEDKANMLAVYPTWPDTQKFTREVKQEVTEANAGNSAFFHEQFTFSASTQIVEEIGERYGRWQDSECLDLKRALMKMEEADTGRVPLKDFYGNALGGAWQFTESIEYLRELGALDETDPKRKSVIISNYINAPSNCLASSGLYSVCCLNECEALLGHVEQAIGEPDAKPQSLVDVVGNLPSSTVTAPRTVSATMRNLLEEVASHHGGRVPLHGRLFSQWMHHAYPRECPYPHKSGTVTPLTAEEWMNERGGSAVAEVEDMQRHVDEFEAHARAAEDLKPNSPLMWSAEEELVVTTTVRPGGSLRWLFSVLGKVALLAVLVSGGVSLRHLLGFTAHQKSVLPYSGKKHFC